MELVECIEEYWEFVRMIRTHSENKDWFFSNSEISKDQQVEYMKINSDKYKICLLDKMPVGYIGLLKDDEITYCVHPDYKGRGIGTFMVSEIMKNNGNLSAFVYPQNEASKKVFENLGFQKRIFYFIEEKK